MIVELLPSHARDGRLQPCTTFRINRSLAIDAGALGLGLTPDEQQEIDTVVVTHAHADHVCSLPMFVSETYPRRSRPLEVYATRHCLEVLRAHVFNGEIFPDFERVPLRDGSQPSLKLVEIDEMKPFRIGGLELLPIPVNHTVPTVGLLVDDGEVNVAFSSDTYTTDDLWRVLRSREKLRCVYADVSYSSDSEDLAGIALHFTPTSLVRDLKKLARADVQILAVHLKPSFRERIVREIEAMNHPQLALSRIGHAHDWRRGSNPVPGPPY